MKLNVSAGRSVENFRLTAAAWRTPSFAIRFITTRPERTAPRFELSTRAVVCRAQGFAFLLPPQGSVIPSYRASGPGSKQ
jgi:hypothetical protein